MFPDILIGSVYVTDADDYDVPDKTFNVDSTRTKEEAMQYFGVSQSNGNITMKTGTPGGNYTLFVKVGLLYKSEASSIDGKTRDDVITHRTLTTKKT